MLEPTRAAFAHFAQAIESGESGVFFSDYSPREKAEFYGGTGDYTLVDFEAPVFPKFSVLDWKGAQSFHYSFKNTFNHSCEEKSEKPEALKWLKTPVDSELFTFEMRPGKAWQNKVQQVIEHQKNGEAWVLNLAHDYAQGEFENLTEMKRSLLQIFDRFLTLEKAHSAGIVITNEQIFCSLSPELFIRQKDSHILTSPIKGTGSEDYLNTSEKEKSELDMVTDLLRNDLGQICQEVKVLNPRFLVPEKNFYSARSLIVGGYDQTLSEANYQQLLPAGSISGAPKKRVTEIIEALEDFDRGFYTGTMGVQIAPGESVWNILIRTIFINPDKLTWSFPVGVGLTAESDPAAEWNETWQKAQLLTDLVS